MASKLTPQEIESIVATPPRNPDSIGQGTRGTVYSSRHSSLEVAVKIFDVKPEDISVLEDYADKFQEEREGVVQVLGYGTTGDTLGRFCLVMKKYTGSVADYIQERNKQNSSAFKEDQEIAYSLEILLNVLNIIEPLHKKGTMHRDLRPENIVRDEQGRVYINDFQHDPNPNAMSTAPKKPRRKELTSITIFSFYPKGEDGNLESADAPRDLYTLTQATALELLADSWPIRGNICNKNDRIPALIAEVLEKGRAEDRGKRYQNASDYFKALKEAIENESIFHIVQEKSGKSIYYRVWQPEKHFEVEGQKAVAEMKIKGDGLSEVGQEEIKALKKLYDTCNEKRKKSPVKAKSAKGSRTLDELLSDSVKGVFEKVFTLIDGNKDLALPLKDIQRIKTLYDQCQEPQYCPNLPTRGEITNIMKQKLPALLERILTARLNDIRGGNITTLGNINGYYEEFKALNLPEVTNKATGLMKQYLPKMEEALINKDEDLYKSEEVAAGEVTNNVAEIEQRLGSVEQRLGDLSSLKGQREDVVRTRDQLRTDFKEIFAALPSSYTPAPSPTPLRLEQMVSLSGKLEGICLAAGYKPFYGPGEDPEVAGTGSSAPTATAVAPPAPSSPSLPSSAATPSAPRRGPPPPPLPPKRPPVPPVEEKK